MRSVSSKVQLPALPEARMEMRKQMRALRQSLEVLQSERRASKRNATIRTENAPARRFEAVGASRRSLWAKAHVNLRCRTLNGELVAG